jgi:RimJ/RimL family protein N-acetyltransferase
MIHDLTVDLLRLLPLRTARLTLRAVTERELEPLAAMLADPEVMRYFPRPMLRTEAEAFFRRNLARYRADGTGLFAVYRGREWIGDCGLIVREVDGRPELELGYHFRRDTWRQGYATEAARACLDAAWTAGAATVLALIRPENTPSRRVAHRAGLRVDGAVWHAGFAHEVWRITRREQERSGRRVGPASPKLAAPRTGELKTQTGG